MKIIALIGDQPNHKYLCERINRKFALDAVVIVNKKSPVKRTAKGHLLSQGMKKILSLPLAIAWRKMQASFQQDLSALSSVKRLVVDDVNAQAVVDLVAATKPELVFYRHINRIMNHIKLSVSKPCQLLDICCHPIRNCQAYVS